MGGINVATQAAIDFLSGKGTDHVGRTVDDYLKFTGSEWEDCHDHIQWAFPSHISSEYNPYAPVVDMVALCSSSANYRNTLYRLMDSYMNSIGFVKMDGHIGWTYVGSDNNWITPYNHNFLRITRFLNLLHYFDAELAAVQFMEFVKLARTYDCIDRETVLYWVDAATGNL